MHLAEIWRYPVKSMIGERITSAELGASGIAGDRIWATRDLERGGIRGAKQIGGLMRFAARADAADRVTITCPDGTEVSTTDPDIDAILSQALGHPVRLEALRPASDTEHYRRGGPDHADVIEELRAIFDRDPDEPLPDFSVFPPEIIEYESPPGTYHDAFPLMIMTTSAIAALGEAVPDSVIDLRRFRPSLLIDAGTGPGHPEFGWAGRRARLGEAVIEVLAPCPRCVMVTREVCDEVPGDRAVLRHIVRDLDQNLGMYARILQPGTIQVGDPFDWQD